MPTPKHPCLRRASTTGARSWSTTTARPTGGCATTRRRRGTAQRDTAQRDTAQRDTAQQSRRRRGSRRRASAAPRPPLARPSPARSRPICCAGAACPPRVTQTASGTRRGVRGVFPR
eukprot:3110133-Prymnesium_polylepis.1